VIEPRIPWKRAGLVQAGFLIFALALVGRAVKVQLLDRDLWRQKARAQQMASKPLPAPRGTILDANGIVLVESRQLVKITIAPNQVVATLRRKGDGIERMATLTRALALAGVSQELIAKVRDTSRKWVEIPGRYLATDVSNITSLYGVNSTPALERVPPANDGLRRLVGRADDAGGPVDGLEKSLDQILRGEGGRESLVRDARGRQMRSPAVPDAAPTPGNTVVLSINQGLQDIAERALGEAVATMRATGGDIVMLDPTTGEVRAMVSHRADKRSTVATALSEPYEPGSTLKPFAAARLLDLGRARSDEIINTHGGKWELNGRKIEDDHPLREASLFDVIKFSSNIGIIQFAGRFSRDEQFELYRDLGFGTPTGIPYPVESQGRLPVPRTWTALTPASLAMGYEVSVTPMQLATAYAAIANGGELLEPAIVKEIRTPSGEVTNRHTRRVVRRVMTEASARAVRGMLRGVVEAGTAVGSNLSTFDVAGKTGTSKVAGPHGYIAGRYTASFVGMFPADNPQLVILVKLDSPTKSIYGGRAAAPVSKVVLQAALAARDAALDRRTLAEEPSRKREPVLTPVVMADAKPDPRVATIVAPTVVETVVETAAVAAPAPAPRSEPSRPGSVAWVARLDEPRETSEPVVAMRTVPDVAGMPVRRAVYELHRAGFRAALAGTTSGGDKAARTSPAAGTALTTGSRVTLERAP